jgi:hypothetical protein
MFLTKKTATNQTKKPNNTRALGGWDDVDDDKQYAVNSNNYNKISENSSSNKYVGSTREYNSGYLSNPNTNLLEINKVIPFSETKGANGKR